MPQVGCLYVETAHSICVRVIQLDCNHTLNVVAFDLYAVHLPILFLQTFSPVASADPTASPPLLLYMNRILDLLTLYFLLRFTRKPLRFFGLLGSALLLPGVLINLYLFLDRVFLDHGIAGRPLLLLGILLTVLGVQMISIGLIGEMIIFTHSREIRDYSIREVLE